MQESLLCFSVPFLVFPNPSSDGVTSSESSFGDVTILSMYFSLSQSMSAEMMFSDPFPLSHVGFATEL